MNDSGICSECYSGPCRCPERQEREYCEAVAKKWLQNEGWHGSEFNYMAPGPLSELLTKERDDARAGLLEKSCELHAKHVDAMMLMAKSGVPAEVIVSMVAKTFRSDD